MKREDVLLIVEDNSFELQSYMILAKNAGLKALGVSTIQDARKVLESCRVDILLTDMFLSAGSKSPEGLDLLEEAREMQVQIVPIVMSSHPDVKIYQQAMDRGALFALKKPLINADEILIAINSAKEKRLLKHVQNNEQRALSPELESICPDGLCVEANVLKWIRVAAETTDLPVVIQGETGTGKEEVAKLIAKYRKKKEGEIPFLSVNCSLLDGNLSQSLLFGHKKGAFSGAYTTTQGFVGEADGGILFLDEIHTLSIACQQKLLRVLNDGTYNRVGDTKELYSKFQVVVASTIDLDLAVESSKFLLDLRVRLTGCEITLSPLRDRMSDLPLLIQLFFAKRGMRVGEMEFEAIVRRCRDFYWQGNIRQLFQCLKALVAISHADGKAPLAENLPILKTMKAPSNN